MSKHALPKVYVRRGFKIAPDGKSAKPHGYEAFLNGSWHSWHARLVDAQGIVGPEAECRLEGARR